MERCRDSWPGQLSSLSPVNTYSEQEEAAESVRLLSFQQRSSKMCIPRVSPATGSFFVVNLAKLSLKPNTFPVLSKQPTVGIMQRTFSTIKCGSNNRLPTKPDQQAPICPFLTYFSIVSVFMIIVAMNNLHDQHHKIGD